MLQFVAASIFLSSLRICGMIETDSENHQRSNWVLTKNEICQFHNLDFKQALSKLAYGLEHLEPIFMADDFCLQRTRKSSR